MSLLTQASLVLTPTSYKANKLYSVVPSSGNGDMTTTRATTATRINSSGLVENVFLHFDVFLLAKKFSNLIEEKKYLFCQTN